MTATDNKILRIYEAALTVLSCFDDKTACRNLEETGRYGAFDEPGSVQIARVALRDANKIRTEFVETQDCTTCANEYPAGPDCDTCWEGHAGHFPNWKPKEKPCL